MKYLLLSALLLTGFGAQGQQGLSLQGRVVQGEQLAAKTVEGFPGVTVLLTQADSTITGAGTSEEGKFSFSGLPAGTYTLALKVIGYPIKKAPVGLIAGLPANLTIPLPGPCRYGYPKQQLPACVDEHTDGLIPIVYGLPKPSTMQRAKEGKVYLGGCQVTGCDPRYYCPVHKREL